MNSWRGLRIQSERCWGGVLGARPQRFACKAGKACRNASLARRVNAKQVAELVQYRDE